MAHELPPPKAYSIQNTAHKDVHVLEGAEKLPYFHRAYNLHEVTFYVTCMTIYHNGSWLCMSMHLLQIFLYQCARNLTQHPEM